MSLGCESIALITAGYDQTILFWNFYTAAAYRTIKHEDSPINCLAIHPKKTLLAVGGNPCIKMYDLTSNNPNPVMKLDQLQKNILTLGFYNDGNFMYSGGENHYVRIWDMKKGEAKPSRQYVADAAVNSVALYEDQTRTDLLFGDQHGAVYHWNFAQRIIEKTILDTNNPIAIRSVSVNRDGSMTAAVTSNGDCQIWSIAGFEPEKRHLVHRTSFAAHKLYGLKCLFSPDMTLLATTSADGTAKIWHTSDFSCQFELKHNQLQYWVWDCAFTSDSVFLITVCSDGKARLWSMETGNMVREYIGHQKGATCLAFNDQT